MDFFQTADRDPEFAEELPKFITEIKEIFEPWEIKEYLESVERVGPLGHVCTDDQYETFRSSGALLDDPVGEAEDIILVERIKKLLLII